MSSRSRGVRRQYRAAVRRICREDRARRCLHRCDGRQIMADATSGVPRLRHPNGRCRRTFASSLTTGYERERQPVRPAPFAQCLIARIAGAFCCRHVVLAGHCPGSDGSRRCRRSPGEGSSSTSTRVIFLGGTSSCSRAPTWEPWAGATSMGTRSGPAPGMVANRVSDATRPDQRRLVDRGCPLAVERSKLAIPRR